MCHIILHRWPDDNSFIHDETAHTKHKIYSFHYHMDIYISNCFFSLITYMYIPLIIHYNHICTDIITCNVQMIYKWIIWIYCTNNINNQHWNIINRCTTQTFIRLIVCILNSDVFTLNILYVINWKWLIDGNTIDGWIIVHQYKSIDLYMIHSQYVVTQYHRSIFVWICSKYSVIH